MYVTVFVKDDYPKQEGTFAVSVRISGNIGVIVDDTYKACESLWKNLTMVRHLF